MPKRENLEKAGSSSAKKQKTVQLPRSKKPKAVKSPKPKEEKADGVERAAPGLDYQVQLLMLAARQGYEFSIEPSSNYCFEVGKERKEAGKFDDIVFRYKNNSEPKWNYLVLQSKHKTYKEGKEEKITTGNLLSSNNTGPFVLIKYFSSHVKSREDYGKATDSNGIENCVIVTNSDFQYDPDYDSQENNDYKLKPANTLKEYKSEGRRGKSFYLENCSVNRIFTIEKTKAKVLKFSSKYKKRIVDEMKTAFIRNFNKIKASEQVLKKESTNQEILNNLKNIINDDRTLEESLNDFLDKLIFIVNLPDRNGIRSIVKEKIGEEFLTLDDSIVDQFNRKMFDYTINKDKKQFLRGEEIEQYFNQMKQTINLLDFKPYYYNDIKNTVINFKPEMRRNISFDQFLSESPESASKRILVINTESLFLTTVKIYSLLQESQILFKQYKYKGKHALLSLKELKNNVFKTNLLSFFHDQNGYNLLIIQIDHNHSSMSTITKLLEELLPNNINSNKKLVLITPKDFELDSSLIEKRFSLNCDDNDIHYKDLTKSSQKKLLDKEVNVQGNNYRLKNLFFESNELSNEQLNQINLGPKTIETLKESYPNRIDKPLTVSDLEGAYTRFNESITGIVTKLSLSDSYFIISGISENQFFTKFVSTQQTVIAENIKKGISDGRISFEINEFKEENFKKFCNDDKSGYEIYWICYKNNEYILEYLFNPKFYLDRKFYYPEKVTIDFSMREEFLKENSSSFFLITGVDNEVELIELLKLNNQQAEAFKQHIRKDNIAIMKEIERKLFLDMDKSSNRSKHWLHVEDEKGTKHLIWRETRGLLGNLLHYSQVKNKTVNSDKNLLDELTHEKVLLLIDKPGMGKSTTLVSLSQKLLATHWIIHINLRDCAKGIQNLPVAVIKVNDVLTFLSDIIKSPLENDLIRFKLEHKGGEKSLRMIFDGFDEIKGDTAKNFEKSKVISLLQFLQDQTYASIWVSAREHDAPLLQDSLAVFCTRFEEFSPEMQKNYFRNTWMKHLILNSETVDKNNKFQKYYNSLSEAMTKILPEKKSNFMGIPLTLRLFSEIFKDKFKKFVYSKDDHDITKDFDNLSILTLYQQFVDKKFEIFFGEKTKLSHGFNDVSKGWLKDTIIKKYQRLAFHELYSYSETMKFVGKKSPFLPEEESLKMNVADLGELLRIGLVQSFQTDHFELIHRTFAEFFVANFFVYMLKNKRSDSAKYDQILKFISEEIFKVENIVILKFLKAMAQENIKYEWNNQLVSILSKKNNNLLGDAPDESVKSTIEWNTNPSDLSSVKLPDLRYEVESFLGSSKKSGCYQYNRKDCELIKKLSQKFFTETDIDHLKSTLNLWLNMSNCKTNYDLANFVIEENLYHLVQHFVTQAKLQNKQHDLEWIKKKLPNREDLFESSAFKIVKNFDKKIDNVEKLPKEDLIKIIFSEYKEHEGGYYWLERDGIEIVKSLKLLTLDMSNNFIAFIQNEKKPNGFHDGYARNVFYALVRPILNFISYEENVSSFHIEEPALLNIIRSVVNFSSQRSISLELSENELKSLLKSIENVMKLENLSPQNLFYGIETLRALKNWSFSLIRKNDNLYLENENNYVHKLTLTYDTEKLESLLLFRLKNPQNDETFLEECKKVYASIQESESEKMLKTE